MKKSLLAICPLVLGSFLFWWKEEKEEYLFSPLEQRSVTPAIGCSPAPLEIGAGSNGKFITVMPGWGQHSYSISTTSDSAQFYFNQGLTMYYSYHAREAIASFKEAARFDSASAMVYWGQALAEGPSYNFGHSYKMRPSIPEVLQKMNRHAHGATAKEQDLISAMNKRYNVNDSTDAERKKLNVAYAAAMKPLVAKYASDVDIKALYTDAVMLIHPWDFWYNDGRPKPWTTELVNNCEAMLASDPQHPGALHYYIHVTEASRNPQVALASADSLIKLFPGVAHMVHMSSHEYERIGYYQKGVIANEKADESLVRYYALAKELFPQVHVLHYYAVDAYCALSGAMYQEAIKKSHLTRQMAMANMSETYSQHAFMFPQLTMVRMGKWQELLNDTTTLQPQWTYALLLNDFVKGMAWSKLGHQKKAERHLQALRLRQRDTSLRKKFDPRFNSPYEVSKIAEHLLLATIRFHQKQPAAAITAAKQAIQFEDSLIYMEPKIWMFPVRQYLGAFYLQLNNAAEAEKVYRDDLAWNPGNGWSLLGLHQALRKQGKKTGLDKLERQYQYSFSGADVLPITSAY